MVAKLCFLCQDVSPKAFESHQVFDLISVEASVMEMTWIGLGVLSQMECDSRFSRPQNFQETLDDDGCFLFFAC